MIAGTLKIHWDNSDNPADTRMYRASFVTSERHVKDALAHKEILGEESLLDYLIGIQPASVSLERRAQRAEEWLAAVHSAGHLYLENTQITEEQFQVFTAA
jgi:hypothetical protein